MADPKEEKIEKRVEETESPKPDSELSDADIEKVSGGIGVPMQISDPPCVHRDSPPPKF